MKSYVKLEARVITTMSMQLNAVSEEEVLLSVVKSLCKACVRPRRTSFSPCSPAPCCHPVPRTVVNQKEAPEPFAVHGRRLEPELET